MHHRSRSQIASDQRSQPITDTSIARVANSPASYRSPSGPSGPKCPGSVLGVSPKTGGVRRSVPWGVSKSVPRVPGVSGTPHCGATLGTLFGHSGVRGLSGPGDTPWDTPSDTPHFRGHSGTLPGTLPKDSPGSSQRKRSCRKRCLFGVRSPFDRDRRFRAF